jgi:nucleoside-diphosphate-sugar epimerase
VRTSILNGPRTVAVTGATGLLGRALCLHLEAYGWSVRALARRDDPELTRRGIPTLPCDLPDHIDAKTLEGCDILVHAAYTTRYRTLEDARRTNEEGTQRLLQASRRANINRFVFISSLSAHPDALSYYGQSKLRIESLLDQTRDLTIRPGLLLSLEGGLFKRMLETVRRSPLVPLFGGGRQPIQTLHIDDCCVAIRLALETSRRGSLSVAEPEPTDFRGLMVLTAEALGRHPRMIDIPIGPSLAALRLAERMGLRLPASSENLLGLLSLRPVETAADLSALGIRVRRAAESIRTLLGRT